MFRRVWVAMMIAAIAGVGVLLGMSLPVTAQQDPSATRSISPATVAPGGEVMVTITAANFGSFGAVEETLPSGFAYVAGSLDDEDIRVTVGAGTVRFSFQQGVEPFTYTVTASDQAGPYSFSGNLRDDDRDDHAVGGATSVTVEAVVEPAPDEPSATRSISPATVAPGGEVMVTITVADYGSFGGVVETLPSGFAYVAGSLDDEDIRVTVGAGTVRFSFQQGVESFTYTVTASDQAGPYSLSGNLRDDDQGDHAVGGATSVTVEAVVEPAPDEPSATRSISPARVAPGGEVMVTITVANYGSFGGVVETLPSGFDYVEGSLDDEDIRVTVGAGTVRFSFQQGVESFTYTVTASDQVGPYSFSGNLRDDDQVDHVVGGATSVTVRVAAPPPPVQPQQNRAPVFTDGAATTRSIDENSASGANVDAAVRATDADRDRLTYVLGGTDDSSFTISSSTGQIMVGTGTMLDFEDKASYVVTVSATDPDNDSDTISVTVTVVNVDEDGIVTIMPDTTPQVGTELTASLEDPDGGVANLTWQWQKDDGQGNYVDIPGATMMSYTPVMADDDSRLQATAMYDDVFGEDKTAMMPTANAVGAAESAVDYYDANDDGSIQKMEYLWALDDYLDEIIEKPAQLEVLDALIDFLGS